ENIARGGADALAAAAGDAASLSADAWQHRRRQKLDHRVSGAGRLVHGARRAQAGGAQARLARTRPSPLRRSSADGRLVPHDRHIRLALDQLLERAALRLAAHATLQSDEFAGRRHPDAGGPEAWVAPDCGGDPLVDLRIALVGATALAGSGETARGAALG